MATKKTTSTEVVDWEKEMQEQARIAAEAQRSSGGGGKFFSMQGGILQAEGQPLPGNQMSVIILAHILENSWYEGAFDPNTPASPKCFAFGQHETAMEPHPKVDEDDYFERQHSVCADCPRNEWGSADVGRGKACKNVVRIAVIPAGIYKATGKGRNVSFEYTPIEDESHFARAEVMYLKIPVMSVKHFSKYVKQLAGDLGRPPHGVITNIYLEPDPKSQFSVNFEIIDNVPGELLPTVMNRHKQEMATIDFPYSPPMEDDERPAAKPAKSNNKLRGRGRK